MLEILSPVASTEAVIAAVQSGADSIYIRFGGSGARGFTQDELKKAVRYCRVRGCRVWAELDTLVSDNEMAAAADLARSASKMGAYGFIVQDLGLIPVVSAVAPDLKIAAGERLGLHSLAAVEAAAQLGVSLVFLSPELAAGEIALLAKRASIKLAVTVFGSLCVSRGGLCYLSALMDKSPANRGACSGICRDKFDMGGRLDEYPLSLKDVQLLSRLSELEEAGVSCAVIGSDIQRPEQIAMVTRLCSDCAAEGRVPSPGELGDLELAFSGRSFTEGYYTGELSGLDGTHLTPEKDAERPLAAARKEYADSELRRVQIQFFADVQRHKAMRFAIIDEDRNRAVWNGPAPSNAAGAGIRVSDIETELYKTSGTPYICRRSNIRVGEGLLLPSGMLSEVRRMLIRELTEKRASAPKARAGKMPEPSATKARGGHMSVIFQVLSEEQLSPELAELSPDYLYLPLSLAVNSSALLEPFTRAGCTPVAVLPTIIHDGQLQELLGDLRRVRAVGVTQVLASSLGHIAAARMAEMDVRGDYGLNIYNSHAMALAEKAGLLSATASFELKMSQIKLLSKPIDTEIIAYGRLPVMVTEICLIKNSAGKCVCHARQGMSDNRGGIMPVVREPVCRNAVYAARKVFLADRLTELDKAGLWGARLLFTTEGARECVEVAKGYLGLSNYRPNGLTRGLYY